MPNTLRETVREDGLRVITKKLAKSEMTRVAVLALVGSAHDPPHQDGKFHLFEHVAFLGTKKYSAFKMQMLANRYFFAQGARTGPIVTSYYILAPHEQENFNAQTDVLFETYLHPLLFEDDIQKEKEVVLNEILENREDDRVTALYAQSELLWKNNPMRKYGVGTPEGIKSVTRLMLLRAHRKYYVPSNTVIVGTGRINHDLLAEKAFSFFPPNNARVEQRRWKDESEVLPSENEVVLSRSGRELATLSIGCKLPCFSEREQRMFVILTNMLESMLARTIKQERGFTYDVLCSIRGYVLLGAHLYATIRMLAQRVSETRKLMFDILCDSSLNPDEFVTIKEGLKGHAEAHLRIPGEWEALIEAKVLCGEDLSPLDNYEEELKNTLSGIEFEEVVAVREKYMRLERMVCAAILPV